MKFFKPNDFYHEHWINLNSIKPISPVDAAVYANEKIEREGKVLYGNADRPMITWFECQEKKDSHKALLINIEPLEKCTHPAKAIFIYRETPDSPIGWKCDECGARVEPSEFKEVK